MSGKITPVILSGGSGTRLWPLSRSLYPKQLLALAGPDTMIQATARRVSDAARFAPPLVVAGEDHRFIIAEQLRVAGVEPQGLILEPAGRNTAPAIALAALHLLLKEPEGVMLIMPSDHVIGDAAAFHAATSALLGPVRDGWLGAYGVAPTHAETGYGYIESGEPLAAGVNAVARFVEKPDAATAQAYVDSGRYAWNSGIFLMRADRYLAELEIHAPEVLAAAKSAMAQAQTDGLFLRPAKAAFLESPNISIDYAVMERSGKAAVAPVSMKWSDVGSWSALWELGPHDAAGNVCHGDIVPISAKGCYLNSEGPMIAALGVEDLVVVATSDAVLVTTKARAQEVKAITDELKRQKRTEHASHVTVHRPWGTYQTTDSGARFQTKRIVVNPGEKLSLQMHHHRAEHWIVVQGTAKVTCGDKVIMLHENESTFIPMGETHRLENPGKIPLHLIEVQSGGYLGEDDIVRFQDTYGRA